MLGDASHGLLAAHPGAALMCPSSSTMMARGRSVLWHEKSSADDGKLAGERSVPPAGEREKLAD
jgi:hypothetical protein